MCMCACACICVLCACLHACMWACVRCVYVIMHGRVESAHRVSVSVHTCLCIYTYYWQESNEWCTAIVSKILLAIVSKPLLPIDIL